MNRVFSTCLLISLAIHSIIFIQNPGFNLLPAHKTEERLELSYIKEAKVNIPAQAKQAEPFLKMASKITVDRRMPPAPPAEGRNAFKNNAKLNLSTPNFEKPASRALTDIISVKKKITLPPVDMDKINNPSYISYYQIVREKIKRAAYQNYNRAQTGEVYISFVIANSGYISEARLVEEKSSLSEYLGEIALRSVKDASPFPVFPKELDYPRMSFNVIISFEIE